MCRESVFFPALFRLNWPTHNKQSLRLHPGLFQAITHSHVPWRRSVHVPWNHDKMSNWQEWRWFVQTAFMDWSLWASILIKAILQPVSEEGKCFYSSCYPVRNIEQRLGAEESFCPREKAVTSIWRWPEAVCVGVQLISAPLWPESRLARKRPPGFPCVSKCLFMVITSHSVTRLEMVDFRGGQWRVSERGGCK